MADTQITFTIREAAVPRVINAMKGLYPFTDGQWAKESVRRFIIKSVQRYESKEAIDTAKDSINTDDTLIS